MGSTPMRYVNERCGWCSSTVASTVALGSDLLGRREAGPKAETVRLWVRQAERDTGRRPGATTEELAELKRLKRENAELRRANDILKAAAQFFGAELDRQSTK
jgi:hypothetical protein